MTGLLDRLASVKRPEDSVTLEGIPGGDVTFRFRALGHTRSSVVLAQNPPKPGNKVHQALGYDPETYYSAIIKESCHAIVADDETVVVRETDGKLTGAVDDVWWTQLFENLNTAQFNKLFTCAFMLDSNDAVPSSALGSLTSQPVDESSTPPEAGQGRARSGGTAGSRSKSRRTSTTKPAA